MRYLEDYDVAQRHATAAVVHMKSRAIPWNPRNFTIWYEYVAGGNDALKQMINSLGVSDDDLCHDQLASVYAKTTKSLEAAPQAHEWAEKIELVANQIVEAISDIGRDTRLYGQALEIFSGDIVGTTNLSDFNSHVAKILSETRIMDSQTHALQTRVNDASEEIETLKQSLDEARRDAVTDGLTGVAIRKGFDEALEQAVEISKEKHAPLSLIIADLDHFKLFNDTHGRQVGDRVLRVVGATLRRSVKGQDTPARFGGKEFAMVLPNTTVGGACAVAEVIRKAIATTKLVRKGTDQKIASISVSVGVTEYGLGEPISEFVERANEALYQAKKSGRNRVVSDVRLKKPA